MTLLPHICIFCKCWSRDLNSFYQAGIYTGSTKYYHENCFQQVLNHPEKHGHKAVDMAMKITEKITIEKTDQKREELEYQANIKKLKTFKP